MWQWFQMWKFQTQLADWYLHNSRTHYLGMNARRPPWWEVNTGSGNGLVLSGRKPLLEPMLSQIYVITSHIELQHWLNILTHLPGANELIYWNLVLGVKISVWNKVILPWMEYFLSQGAKYIVRWGTSPHTPLLMHNTDISYLLCNEWLTYWGLDTMAAILQTTFSNTCSSMKIFVFRFKIHWRLFLRIQLTIKSTLVQVMAWCQPGAKPLPESKSIKTYDAI